MGKSDSNNYNGNYNVTYFGVQFEWSETLCFYIYFDKNLENTYQLSAF